MIIVTIISFVILIACALSMPILSWQLFYMGIRLNWDIQKEVHKKFDGYLRKIIQDENIELQICSFDELNVNETIEARKAVGKYIRYFSDENGMFHPPYKRVYKRKIQLTDNYHVYTMAHEVGHHFAIKLWNDETEEGADKYIHTLATQCLEEWEVYAISIGLEVHSKVKMKFNQFKIVWQYLKHKLKNKFRK